MTEEQIKKWDQTRENFAIGCQKIGLAMCGVGVAGKAFDSVIKCHYDLNILDGEIENLNNNNHKTMAQEIKLRGMRRKRKAVKSALDKLEEELIGKTLGKDATTPTESFKDFATSIIVKSAVESVARGDWKEVYDNLVKAISNKKTNRPQIVDTQ